MKTIDDLFARTLSALWQRGESSWLATVLAVDGSAYRHEGAKLIVGPDGQPVGLISGGCLEGDVALRTLAEGSGVRLLTYALADEGLFGMGAGCPGTVRILLERLDPPGRSPGPLHRFLQDLLLGRRAVLATVVAEDGSGAIGRLYGNDQGQWLGEQHAWQAACAQVLAEERPLARAFRGKDGAWVLIDVCAPAQSLVVFGAGDDALPLVSLARQVGFRVTVADHRPNLLAARRLPGVRRVDLRRPPGPASLISPGAAVVVMNHHLQWDAHALALALSSPAAYIGLLGPIGRSDRTLALLAENGTSVSATVRRRIHTPGGLDIGARTPEEIALSLLSEIVASRERRPGTSLSGHRGPLHHAPREIEHTEVGVHE